MIKKQNKASKQTNKQTNKQTKKNNNNNNLKKKIKKEKKFVDWWVRTQKENWLKHKDGWNRNGIKGWIFFLPFRTNDIREGNPEAFGINLSRNSLNFPL